MSLEKAVQLIVQIGDFEELQQPFPAMKSSIKFHMRCDFSSQRERVFNRSPTMSGRIMLGNRCRVVTRVRGEGRNHGGLGLRRRGEGIGHGKEASLKKKKNE